MQRLRGGQLFLVVLLEEVVVHVLADRDMGIILLVLGRVDFDCLEVVLGDVLWQRHFRRVLDDRHVVVVILRHDFAFEDGVQFSRQRRNNVGTAARRRLNGLERQLDIDFRRLREAEALRDVDVAGFLETRADPEICVEYVILLGR